MSQTSNDNILFWIQMFTNIFIQNPNGIEIMEDSFFENMKKDIPSFISICNQILIIDDKNDDNIKISKQVSSYFLLKVLEYQNATDLSNKRSTISNETSEQTKNTLNQNIFSENPIIRNNCIKCYSLLFSILAPNWKEGITNIVNSFSNTNLIPNGFIVFLSIMRELITSIIFVTEILPTFSEQFTQVFVISIEILSKEPQEQVFIPQLRTEACKYVHELINVYPPILNDGEKVGIKIPFLLGMLPNSFQIDDINLYANLIDLLLIIVQKFYLQSMKFMETISTYVLNGFCLTNGNYACLSIDFWNKVAQYEEKLIERTLYSNNPDEEIQPLKPLLSELAFKPLIHYFMLYIETIDVNDIVIENKERTGQYKHIIITIGSIYKIVPLIFNEIKEIIDNELSKEKWTNVYAGILLLNSIGNEPAEQEVGIYIINHLDFLLQKSMPDQIPRLRYNSLLVIGLLITNYSHLILQQNEIADKMITELIKLFLSTIQIDEKQQKNISTDDCFIFQLYASLIYSLSSLWYNEENSNLGLYFDSFYEILSTLFNYGIYNDFIELIEKTSDALNRLISFSTDDSLVKFSVLYEKSLDQLFHLKNSILNEKTCYFAISCYCSNMTTMLLRLKKNEEICELIISQYAERTIQVLFDILQIKNEDIWKEAFWTIASLIIATNSLANKVEIFSPYTFNILINQFIHTAFLSNDPNLIRATCCLISNLFLYLSKKIQILQQLMIDIFNILIGLIDNNQMKDAHPFILDAIANMFLSVDHNDQLINQFELPLFELIECLMDLSNNLDILNEADVEYDNLFYQYLCDVFRGYFKVFHDEKDINHEIKQLLLFDRLASFILKINPMIGGDLFNSFMLAARQCSENCSVNNTAFLKSIAILKILNLGYDNCLDQELRDKMKETTDLILSKQ